jgi:prephenate dehydrogenase
VSFGVPLGLAGVGLIGGSIALRARSLGISVLGFDPDPASAVLVDVPAASLDDLARKCETLVLAMPLDATLAAIDALKQLSSKRPRLVLDVASVKGPVVQHAAGWSRFVATHPLAGREGGGPGAARADLFLGRAWAYVPANAERDAETRDFIERMGAEPIALDAEAHDRAVALTSHLPQVVVSTLAALLAEASAEPRLAGPGLASTLRLAGSPWQLWEAIVRANAAALVAVLRELGERFGALADDLEAGDVSRMASYFEGARSSYERFVRRPGD